MIFCFKYNYTANTGIHNTFHFSSWMRKLFAYWHVSSAKIWMLHKQRKMMLPNKVVYLSEYDSKYNTGMTV